MWGVSVKIGNTLAYQLQRVVNSTEKVLGRLIVKRSFVKNFFFLFRIENFLQKKGFSTILASLDDQQKNIPKRHQ
jgi:hypothetical protein